MVAQRLLPLALLVTCGLLPLLATPARLAAQSAPSNLISNGDFERGTASWEGLAASAVVGAAAHSGARGALISDENVTHEWITVMPGQTYVLTAWFRWVQFSGDQWGFDHLTIEDATSQPQVRLTSLHKQYERNLWHKVALTFVPTSDRVRISFGMFGPQDEVALHFDDFSLSRRAANTPPSADPTASVSGGAAPLAVSFQARADDADGAVAHYQWRFGDGTEAREGNPTHTYRSRGSYTVVLNVWDHDGALTSRTLGVTVSDTVNPAVTITGPTTQAAYSLTATSIVLSGQATTPSGSIQMVVWDNLRTGEAGSIAITPGRVVDWTTPALALAPGENEILISTSDSRGRAGTGRILVTRQVSGPQIYAVRPLATQVRQYEKYEVTFQVDTVAATPLFVYDESPPPGVAPRAGVTVEGVITTPSGRTLRQPAFYSAEARRDASGEAAFYELTGSSSWRLRFAPVEQGLHRVTLRVEDASGVATAEVGTFTATRAARRGFISVSTKDPRYFQFSDGELYWPIGPAWAVDYRGGQGFNLDRPWLGGLGIYSTNWARWKSTAQLHGNEGFSSQLSFREHYPGHELAQELFYPDGYRMWIASFLDEFHHRLQPNTSYQVAIRLKVADLAGPRDPKHAYGLVVKLHGWPDEPGFEAENRGFRSLIPRISVDRDWHTVVTTYTTGDDEGLGGRNELSIYLENVTAGRAYVDAFSLREVLPGGGLGPEQVRNPRADMHTYVEQRPAAAIDDQLSQAEANGLYLKYVVHDKNDWIPNHLLATGVFSESGGGYHQPRGTRARWLLEQWWRYLAARWGYSTAVHSWELNNEGSPDDSDHYAMAQDFARFMGEQDAHQHLSSTSFWCCWRPAFWGDASRFPDVGYADIHEYLSPSDTFADGELKIYDVARFQAESSLSYGSDRVGKPIIRGEVGFDGTQIAEQLSRPNPGIWFHNLLWAQLNAGAVFDAGYWFREHMEAIDAAAHARAFAAFATTLDLNRGGYADAGAVASNPNLRVYGQLSRGSGKAHLWVQNRQHTWRNVMGIDNPEPITAQSGTVTLAMTPLARYSVAWWDTYSGKVSRSEVLAADATGALTLRIDGLRSDLAVKIVPEGYREPGGSSDQRQAFLPLLLQ